MKKTISLIVSLLFLIPIQASSIGEKEAEEIGTEVYIYGYPLVTMEISRRVMTNTTAPGGIRAPMNQFDNLRQYPTPNYKDFTTPNADTLYSFAWVDLSKEPYILHLPDENKRFYLMQMLDAWTNVFADPGTRITGDKAGNYAITGPSWKGTLPSGVKQLKSPTHMVFILGRTFCTGTKEDYEQVHKLQDQYTLTPLSSFGKPYTPPAGKVDSSVDLKTSVRDQVNRLDAPTFFKLFASLLKDNPPAKADASMVAKMAKIGIVPGKDFVMPHSNTPIGKGLAQAPKLGLAKIMAYQKEAAAMVNGWAITLRTGVYGTNYLMRALTAAIGLGANLPQDAIYPFTSVDANNHPLTGAGKYVLHFTKEEIPPVKGFWSLTMYNPDYFLVANPINRYSINSSTHLKYNKDGSLDVYVQHDSPGKNKEMNWLPAPTGPFILMLRLYWPDESALNGTWKPPAVQKAH